MRYENERKTPYVDELDSSYRQIRSEYFLAYTFSIQQKRGRMLNFSLSCVFWTWQVKIEDLLLQTEYRSRVNQFPTQ